MGLTRWVRSTSEHYLMIDAQDKVARRLGTQRPHRPRGVEIFWRRIYVPLFHLLPVKLRNAIIARMPGSHRKKWTPQPPSRGPAPQLQPAPQQTSSTAPSSTNRPTE